MYEQLVFTVQPELYDGASMKEAASDLSLHIAQRAPAVWFHKDKKWIDHLVVSIKQRKRA